MIRAAQAISRSEPMNVLRPAGPVASQISGLLWGLIILSVAVVLIISVLVIAGIVRQLRRGPEIAPVTRPRQGVEWIYIGVALTTAALVIFTGWTMVTLGAIDSPKGAAPYTIRITARQWWWQIDYRAPEPARSFTTANEVHIPVGVPVRFEIASADVIHSFWIPALGGKTDAIPGRVNDTWLQADKPGTYHGQCVEYCGPDHALMALNLAADTDADFSVWWNTQLIEPATSGPAPFTQYCGTCHTVRGSDARGTVGPDLTHLMSRATLAAGVLSNTPANLAGWIADPQAIKPGSKMPAVPLSGPELTQIVAYLETLR
jgi:cytochrome c oxidase subunit II